MNNKIECPFPRLFPSRLEKNDEFFMQLAYNEAITAWENDEVPVGAVIADNHGEVIATANNQTRKSIAINEISILRSYEIGAFELFIFP